MSLFGGDKKSGAVVWEWLHCKKDGPNVLYRAKVFLISKLLQLKPKNPDILGQKAHTDHLITQESGSWP